MEPQLGKEISFYFDEKEMKGILHGIREITFNGVTSTVYLVSIDDTLYFVPEKDLKKEPKTEPDYQEMYFKEVKEKAANHQKNMEQERTIRRLRDDLEIAYEKKLYAEEQLLKATEKLRKHENRLNQLKEEVNKIKIAPNTFEGAAFIEGITYALEHFSITNGDKKCSSGPQITL